MRPFVTDFFLQLENDRATPINAAKFMVNRFIEAKTTLSGNIGVVADSNFGGPTFAKWLCEKNVKFLLAAGAQANPHFHTVGHSILQTGHSSFFFHRNLKVPSFFFFRNF